MPQNKDSLQNTFMVATVLCLVCAALVSAAAVGLKPIQNANILLDKRANVLKVSGIEQEEIDAAGGINECFESRFTTMIIDLDTGREALEDCEAAADEAGKVFVAPFVNSYDQLWCSKSKKPAVADKLNKKADICGIKYREKYSHVFLLKSEDGTRVEKYVFPVRSYGLWSMMKGYLAVEPDLTTIAGITFYEQAETPGLGGEITNPAWQAKWPEKQIFDGDKIALKVSKAAVEGSPYEIDALSGATITSNGVSALVKFWMGDEGFGPYIKNQLSGGNSASGNSTDKSADNKAAESGVNHG